MKAETVQAFALIGLRALAEYDPTEFKRSTDLSKRSLDDQIESVLEKIRSEPEFEELSRQVYQLRSVESESESQVTSAFLMRQISLACLQRAQALAVGYHRTTAAVARQDRVTVSDVKSVSRDQLFSRHEEYLRLGVMRLLRDLPEYNALFNYRWRDHEIDCVLQPLKDEAPAVLVEFKLRIESVQEARDAFRQLHRVAAGWDKSTVFGILTVSTNDELLHSLKEPLLPRLEGRIFLLIYDAERNEFSHQTASGLLHAVRSGPSH